MLLRRDYILDGADGAFYCRIWKAYELEDGLFCFGQLGDGGAVDERAQVNVHSNSIRGIDTPVGCTYCSFLVPYLHEEITRDKKGILRASGK